VTSSSTGLAQRAASSSCGEKIRPSEFDVGTLFTRNLDQPPTGAREEPGKGARRKRAICWILLNGISPLKT
jgi:hypothetical protein